jgi:hypothetical protein
LHVERRAADDLEHVARCGLLPTRFRQLPLEFLGLPRKAIFPRGGQHVRRHVCAQSLESQRLCLMIGCRGYLKWPKWASYAVSFAPTMLRQANVRFQTCRSVAAAIINVSIWHKA